MNSYEYIIDEQSAALKRLDKALSALSDDFSRSRIQALIGQGHVQVNGQVVETLSAKIKLGDTVILQEPPPIESTPQPENIPLDIVYEDDDMLVINKPAGLVVHPGAGNHDGTLVNALLHHCKDSLSGIGGVLRPGIVHRLDKDTSGLMVVAKHDKAHQGLSDQLKDRSLSRIYAALVFKIPLPPKGFIEGAIGRDPNKRQKMAFRVRGGKEAKTYYRTVQSFVESCALVECKLETGRTHQIRVHMQSQGNPLIGDPVYGAQKTALQARFRRDGYDEDIVERILTFPRQALHAQEIAFIHPVSGEEHHYSVPMPEDMRDLIALL